MTSMTDNRTTELLRKLLEERGVSCQTNYLHASWCAGSKLYEAMDNLDGTLIVDNLTPEQAIAATLGSGTLTAEQVQAAIFNGSSYASYDGAQYYANGINMQAIADELNARAERTCECDGTISWEWTGPTTYYEHELSCGHVITSVDNEPPNYCEECGARIRKAVER